MNTFFPRSRLTARELFLIPEALTRLIIARISVSLFPAKHYMPGATTRLNSNSPPVSKAIYLTISLVINGLASRTPWHSTCLVKALAAHKMLEKRGIISTVHLGVKKSTNNDLEAHAWLSVDGSVIIGGENLDDFREISNC
ncbi:MAG: lasso peptide biosynthesis B2 protein [Bacteroidales bacterium]|nr:lasso peptide biosynthesis B2 protein [Bacteroidales bacterium]